MCTSCVDRLFTSGPAPCPVAGCHVTLRKKGFHAAFFADLTIEREVDIRRRVGAIFNKTQRDFVGLREWNDYLQTVEDLIFEIVFGNEREKKEAEAKVREYEEANRKEIAENRIAEREWAEGQRRREEGEMAALRRRREMAVREREEEKELVDKTKRDTLERLARGDGNAKEIMGAAEKAMKDAQDRIRGDAANVATKSEFAIRGLKAKRTREIEKPYDPFGETDLMPTKYVLQDVYPNEWLATAKNDIMHMVGGYSINEYYSRTMFEAFAGLTVFIGDAKIDEKGGMTTVPNGDSKVITSKSIPKSDDVF